MSSFAFVPRKVAKSAKGQSSTLAQQRPLPLPVSTSSVIEKGLDNLGEGSDAHSKGKSKDRDANLSHRGRFTSSEEDYAVLVSLALSDHALWLDPDLRRALESSPDGFIPVSHLFRRSQVFSGIAFNTATENAIVKAIRSRLQEMIEVRMLVSEPSSSGWYGEPGGYGKDKSGSYEVRRRDWEHPERASREYTRDDWERRTLYLENIPPQYRSILGIVRFSLSLLTPTSAVPPLNLVQTITLPPHHLDKPGDQPKCKGFAFVAFADLKDVDVLLHEWPWDRDSLPSRKNEDIAGEVAIEALKFGFRTLAKRRWDELKEEYLAYRRRLLDEIAAFEDEEQESVPHAPREMLIEPQVAPAPVVAPSMDISSPYPINCLVFVRNVQPETNKTTLRTLFSTAFKAAEVPSDRLDYVDFNKGMDSCHLRLATPHHAQILVEHFTTHPTVQATGLDDAGVAPSPASKPITVELVQGKKEELYWEKVPEKVRRQAVQKAVGEMCSNPGDRPDEEGPAKRRKRKR